MRHPHQSRIPGPTDTAAITEPRNLRSQPDARPFTLAQETSATAPNGADRTGSTIRRRQNSGYRPGVPEPNEDCADDLRVAHRARGKLGQGLRDAMPGPRASLKSPPRWSGDARRCRSVPGGQSRPGRPGSPRRGGRPGDLGSRSASSFSRSGWSAGRVAACGSCGWSCRWAPCCWGAGLWAHLPAASAGQTGHGGTTGIAAAARHGSNRGAGRL